MKNLKITLADGKFLTKLNISDKASNEFAMNPRFNVLGLKYIITEATEEDIKFEKKRLADIEEEYNEVCNYNKKVDRYNSVIIKATNHNEFMNAANHLI